MGQVAVIGGGIAGLTVAYRLQQAGFEVSVLEASPRMGGMIHSERREGYLVEYGPNTIQSGSPALDRLIDDLRLETAIIEADAAAKKRFVVKDDVPVPLPTNLLALLTTTLISADAKLRLLREPFVRAAPPEKDESVACFVERRLGPEILDYAVDPFVAGIFAGIPAELSMRHAFPRLYALEQEHGSLLGGRLKSRRNEKGNASQRKRRRMFSFRDGMQMLPQALASRLGKQVHLDAPVTGLHRNENGWRVAYSQAGRQESLNADAVVLTLPLHRTAGLELDGQQAFAELTRATYAPVRVTALGYHVGDVGHPLDGFGVLVPARERRYRILGALFSSTLFPGRAPDGHMLLTAFLGGQRHPGLALASDDEALNTAHSDLARLLDIQGGPVFVLHIPWQHAIPQYRLGYGAVKDAIDGLERRHPGLYFAGNFRAGISVADTVATAAAVAERVMYNVQ